VAVLKRAALR